MLNDERLLRIVIVLLVVLFCGIPAQAETGKVFMGSISMNDAKGKPLLNLVLDGGCEFDPQPVCRMRLVDTVLDFPLFSGPAQGTAVVRLHPDYLELQQLDISMPGALLHLGDEREEAVDIKLTGSGEYWPEAGELILSKMTLQTDQGLTLTGSLTRTAQKFQARLAANIKQPAKLLNLLGSSLPQKMQGMELSGPVMLVFTAEGDGDSFGPLGLNLKATATLQRAVKLSLGEDVFPLPGFTVKAQVRTKRAASEHAPGAKWSLAGRAIVPGKLAFGPLKFTKPAISFDLAGVNKGYKIDSLVMETGQGLLFKETNVPLSRITLTTHARSKRGGGWLLEDIVLGVPGGSISGSALVEAGGDINADLTGRAIKLEKIGPVMQAFSSLPFGDWGATGELDLGLDGTVIADELAATVRMVIRDLAYMSPMADYMGQGLSADFQLKSTLKLGSQQRRMNGSLKISRGEALFGSAYLNLTDHPLRFKAKVRQQGQDRYKNILAEANWKGYGYAKVTGDLRATGSFPNWRYKASLMAKDINLGAGFDILADAKALENFQGEAGLEGKASLNLDLYADGEIADLTGQLKINDASLTSADSTLEATGVMLSMPLSYRIKGPVVRLGSHYVSNDQWGELQADTLRTPLVSMENAATALALVPNRFFVRDALVLNVLGGTVRLGSLACDNPLSKDFSLSMNTRLRDLDLSQVAAGKFPLQGKLNGELGIVTLTNNALTVPGSIKGDFFGGKVLIDGIYAQNPLVPHRNFGLDLAVHEMDLERLSRAMDIGRVTGKMDLELDDVLVAYGEPVGMTLRAETSGEGDFEKTVSLKAVNSLSVLGTGSGMGDVGVGMFASFFQEFSYARIGFQCSLNNDIFQVRGLIREGGVEYLIKKPFFTGINLVNGNPDNHISFKDMLERVDRVIGDKPAQP